VTDPGAGDGHRGLSRRRLFAAGGVTLGGAALARAGVLPKLQAPAAAATKRFRSPLRFPPELSGADLTIPIREAEVAILPGRKTRMWTYDGSFPGPTIRRPAGETTRVTFKHELPAKAGELSVHLHGGHNASDDDGQPGGLTELQPNAFYCDISSDLSARASGNDLLIAPGASRTYTYEGVEDGAPERAAFQWYHDHRLERTAVNVWNGLAGMWILEDELELALPLPRGDRDLPLMIGDRSFTDSNQLQQPFGDGGSTRNPPGDDYVGRRVLVNGCADAFHKVKGCRYRLRLLNNSNFQPYNLFLTGGVEIVQIATEAGLMPRPLKRKSVLLGPGERAEVIVDFSRAAGKRVRLCSEARGGDLHKGAAKAFKGALMEFRVGAQIADTTSIPQSLRPLPAWVGKAPAHPSHRWKITIGGAVLPRWVINGRSFDPAYTDVTVKLGETATWEIQNASGASHLFHLHHTDWYMLSRNGKTPPPWERCLKETFLLDPGERVVVAGHFSDHPGKFVVHCHMLDHEDHGLMSQFEVAPA
jgi:spore coat protein A